MTDHPIDLPASRIPALLDGRMTQYRVLATTWKIDLCNIDQMEEADG